MLDVRTRLRLPCLCTYVHQPPDGPQPLSNLHRALARMTALRRLRVFQPRRGLPINLQNTMSLHREPRSFLFGA